MLDVTPLVARPWGGVGSLRGSPMSEVGHDGNMAVYHPDPEVFQCFNNNCRGHIHVHLDHFPDQVGFIFSLKWMLSVCSRKQKAAF